MYTKDCAGCWYYNDPDDEFPCNDCKREKPDRYTS